MVRIGICDDESILRKPLRSTLEFELSFHDLDYEILEFESGESFLLKASLTHFDILFLDIEMHGLSGMETAKKLRETGGQTVIIFVTSHPDYVFAGYEVGALNYILKPYENGKIIKVFRLALREINALKDDYYLVEQKSGRVKLPCQQILYFKSEGRQVTAVTVQQSHMFYEKLDMVSQSLPSYFVRIHNRYMVNINHVAAIQTTSLICGTEELPISRSYQKSTAIAFAKKLLR